MPQTAQQYCTAALLRSYQNRDNVLSIDSPQLLVVLDRLFADYYQFAVAENPFVFAARVALVWSVDSWAIPAECDTGVQLELNDGTLVFVVPIDDREIEPDEPSVFRVARRYYPIAGHNGGPVNAAGLIQTYAMIAPSFPLLTTTPPVEWPTQFDPMVVCDLAMYLAEIDGRESEVARLNVESQGWQSRFRSWLGRPELNVRRRFTPKMVPTPNVTPMGIEKQ